MKKLLTILCAISLVFGLVATAGAFSYTLCTDRSSWEAAIGSWTLEDFSDPFLNPGLSIISSNPYFSITGGVMHDRIDNSYGPTTFGFVPDVYAFGGSFNLSIPGGAGTGITVKLATGETYNFTSEISRYTNSFWGFIADTAFDEVIFTECEIGSEWILKRI